MAEKVKKIKVSNSLSFFFHHSQSRWVKPSSKYTFNIDMAEKSSPSNILLNYPLTPNYFQKYHRSRRLFLFAFSCCVCFSEQEILRQEIQSLQAVKSRLKQRVTELEEELKKTKEELEKKASTAQADEEVSLRIHPQIITLLRAWFNKMSRSCNSLYGFVKGQSSSYYIFEVNLTKPQG